MKLALPGQKTIVQATKLVRTAEPTTSAIEVFGRPAVKVTATAAGGWARLVAVLTARTPAGKEIIVSAGGVPTTPGRRTYTIRMIDQATFVPKGSPLLGDCRIVLDGAEPCEPSLPRPADGGGSARDARPHGSEHPCPHEGDLGMKLAFVSLLAAAVVAVPGALAADPGVSSDEIVIGGTAPISGPESAYAVVAQGAKAYFDYVNANGGVFGRDIRYMLPRRRVRPGADRSSRRDSSSSRSGCSRSSTSSVPSTRSPHGRTSTSSASRSCSSAAALPALVRDSAQYPWTMGYLPSFFAEGQVLRAPHREDAPRRHDRRPLRGLRLRQGPAARPAERACAARARS